MKVKVELDKRHELDKKDDTLWNKLCREANLNPKQRIIVSNYIKKLLGTKMNEVQASTEMAYMLSLIETRNYGTKKGSTRLLQVQDRARTHLVEAYGAKCMDANGAFGYDGCGHIRLIKRLESKGVEYDGKLLEE